LTLNENGTSSLESVTNPFTLEIPSSDERVGEKMYFKPETLA